MKNTTLIDTHIHERTYSSDSNLALEDIVSQAIKMGLDGICITDHDSNSLMETARAYSKATGFLIIVGAEILTHEGDLTVFGVDHLPSEKMNAQEMINLTLNVGGVAISAHPFRQNNRGMGNSIRQVKGLSGLEAFNGSTTIQNNLYAYGLSAELAIPAFGASDAHKIEAVGKYATVFPGRIRDTADFIEAVKSGDTCPAVYTENGYEIINIERIGDVREVRPGKVV
ncbi:MAG: PHP domain-containing protein [Desulfobacteraceae bacterium]|nr:PHP domain-containing protein [Desulfobacteraceae bacterium]